MSIQLANHRIKKLEEEIIGLKTEIKQQSTLLKDLVHLLGPILRPSDSTNVSDELVQANNQGIIH